MVLESFSGKVLFFFFLVSGDPTVLVAMSH